MLLCIMDDLERRDVDTVNIPGSLLHDDMDNIVKIQIDGEITELLTRLDLVQYEKHIVMYKGKKVLYVRMRKALHGN